ncbi:MAG: 2'-deoxycytidine 5'-triphosphate deaminase [Myxococcales bacterium]|nr:2'-deoxycytidine 5'-triphosphate deaminase [Myxococcales bacterium]
MSAPRSGPPPGVFPSQEIRAAIEAGHVSSSTVVDTSQVQPSSLDLSLAEEAYAVAGSMLPLAGEDVRTLARRYARRVMDLAEPEVLVRGEVYVALLRESLDLPGDVAAYANSKSSTGRIDLQTRLLTAGNPRYDKVAPGYRGELWLEIIPKSFDVRVRAGDRLNQVILFRQRERLLPEALADLHRVSPLLWMPDGRPAATEGWLTGNPDGLLMTLDLDQDIVGYVAKRSFRPIDVSRPGTLDASEYFDPIVRPSEGALFLSREAFYIFSTYERIAVPPSMAVEMLPYDTSAGEFRAHYAGFFDPGFGYGEAGEVRGTPAVLEVRPYEDDLIVRHRQPVCQMAYERVTALPDALYGVGVQSHYAHQRGPRLSKFFQL